MRWGRCLSKTSRFTTEQSREKDLAWSLAPLALFEQSLFLHILLLLLLLLLLFYYYYYYCSFVLFPIPQSNGTVQEGNAHSTGPFLLYLLPTPRVYQILHCGFYTPLSRSFPISLSFYNIFWYVGPCNVVTQQYISRYWSFRWVLPFRV